MTDYSVTWSYRKKVTTETVEADSPGGAVAKLARNVARRLGARRQSIEILGVAAETPATNHARRVLAHQQALRELAASDRKPPKRVTK